MGVRTERDSHFDATHFLHSNDEIKMVEKEPNERNEYNKMLKWEMRAC